MTSVAGILAQQGLYDQTILKKRQITSLKEKNGLAVGHNVVQKMLLKYRTAAAGLFCKEEILSGIQTI